MALQLNYQPPDPLAPQKRVLGIWLILLALSIPGGVVVGMLGGMHFLLTIQSEDFFGDTNSSYWGNITLFSKLVFCVLWLNTLLFLTTPSTLLVLLYSCYKLSRRGGCLWAQIARKVGTYFCYLCVADGVLLILGLIGAFPLEVSSGKLTISVLVFCLLALLVTGGLSGVFARHLDTQNVAHVPHVFTLPAERSGIFWRAYQNLFSLLPDNVTWRQILSWWGKRWVIYNLFLLVGGFIDLTLFRYFHPKITGITWIEFAGFALLAANGCFALGPSGHLILGKIFPPLKPYLGEVLLLMGLVAVLVVLGIFFLCAVA